MGIPKLNRFLLEKCNNSISKKHLSELRGQKIAIDTSIYLYKFIGQEKLIENFYLMIQIFKHYGITPIFIFDGKPPPEKNEIINMRKAIKNEAENKYNEIKSKLENDTDITDLDKGEIQLELIKLKKQFIRPKKSDVQNIKSIIIYSGLQYCEADGEADELCAAMIIKNEVDACMSDDMDLFVYGCKRIYRYLSLLNHDVIAYDMNSILQTLNVNIDEFKKIIISTGTDYNIQQKITIPQSLHLFKEYKNSNSHGVSDFFEWLHMKQVVEDISLLNNSYAMFDIHFHNDSQCFQSKENKHNLIEFLKPHGFIFI